MENYKEEDYVNGFINNIRVPESKVVDEKLLYTFFHNKYVSKDNTFPSEYNDIKKELTLFKSLYNITMHMYIKYYYCFLAAVFRCMHNDGIDITRKQLAILRKYRSRFKNPNELADYFIGVYLPYREDFIDYNGLKYGLYHGEMLYIRVGHNVVLTHEWGFMNPHEKEVFDIIDDYNDISISALRYFLIGFYYLNHNKYNLNIEMLKSVLSNSKPIVDYMLLNGLGYDMFDTETVLGFFQNSLNKITIK